MNKSVKQITQTIAQHAERGASCGYEKGESQPYCSELLKIHHDQYLTNLVSNNLLAALTETKLIPPFNLYSTLTQQ